MFKCYKALKEYLLLFIISLFWQNIISTGLVLIFYSKGGIIKLKRHNCLWIRVYLQYCQC